MNRYTKRLTDYFKKENIIYYFDYIDDETDEERGCDELTVPAGLSDLPGIIIRAFVSDKGKCSFMVKLGTAKNVYDLYRLYKLLNTLNSKYSFVSFCVNDSKSVLMNLNFLLSSSMSFDIIGEYFSAVVSISAESCKEILPLLWDKIIIDEEEHNFEEDFEDAGVEGPEFVSQDELDELIEDFEPFFEEEESFIDGEQNMDLNDSDEETDDESEGFDEIQFEDLFPDEEFSDESDDSDDSDEDIDFAS